MIGDLLLGASYLRRGLAGVFAPALRRYAVLPIVVCTMVFAILIAFGIELYDEMMAWLLPAADSWWSRALRAALWITFALAVTGTVLFGFTLATNLLGAPFNGLLADAVRRHETAVGAPEFSLGALVRDVPPAILHELCKIGYYLKLAIPIVLLMLLPGIQILAAWLWLLLSAWMAALQYIDYPMTNAGHDLAAIRRTMATRRALVLGFGAAVMLAMVVPILNLVVMPAAVVGATLMVLERFNPESGPWTPSSYGPPDRGAPGLHP